MFGQQAVLAAEAGQTVQEESVDQEDPVQKVNWQKVRLESLPWLILAKLVFLLLLGDSADLISLAAGLVAYLGGHVDPRRRDDTLWYLKDGTIVPHGASSWSTSNFPWYPGGPPFYDIC